MKKILFLVSLVSLFSLLLASQVLAAEVRQGGQADVLMVVLAAVGLIPVLGGLITLAVLVFGIGGFAGMYCGARLQKFVPAKFIKWIMVVCLLVTAGKYIWDFLF